MIERAEKAADYIRKECGGSEIGLILGSGLADSVVLEDAKKLDYSDIPGFPTATAFGHKNEWISGKLCGKRVCMMRGRFHYYEGYGIEDVVLPVRVMKLLGVKVLIVTNAAGGVNTSYDPGDLMLINDHINFCGINPLVGKNDEVFGTRFPDMSHAYDVELRKSAHKCAEEIGITLHDGVYTWISGPSYETPAEIRMIRVIGGDAVGMSTVPEVITARHCGIKVLGISCITNMAAGILDKPLTHDEVIVNGNKSKNNFAELIYKIVEEMTL